MDGLDTGIAGGGRAGREPLPRGLPLHGRRAGLDAAGDPARDGAPGAEAGSQSGAGDPPDGAGPLSALPGEAWPDCELCDGAGVVTQRLASEWLDERG